MPPRNTNDAFLDRFLGVFGVRRPKKRRKTVSKRKKSDFSDDYNNSDVSINDNFQIVREDAQSKKVEEIRSNRAKNSDNKFQDISSKSVDNNKKPKKKRPVLMGFVSVFLVFVITCCIVVGAALIYLFAFVDDNIDADLYDLKLEYTSILYAKDKEGNDVELKRLHGEQNRLWVDYKDIPENVNYAFISCEDKRFEKHSGVDWKRTFFAFANEVFGLRDNRQGGSTITQQLVKNLTKDDDINATRKIREIMRARKLEQIYDKDTILECYLNTIHLGNGVDGVEVASNYYFDKHVSDISLTQAACLAAITNNPSINEP
ncbi:MAG: transglycosylase domain-containing protein, partial [Clostridia bacterium]|nr:transglycosylase domain-containing protein [Clostridia bacterium]